MCKIYRFWRGSLLKADARLVFVDVEGMEVYLVVLLLVVLVVVLLLLLLADLCLLMLEERKCTKTNNRPLCNTISFLAACCCWQHSEIYLGEKNKGYLKYRTRTIKLKKMLFQCKKTLFVRSPTILLRNLPTFAVYHIPSLQNMIHPFQKVTVSDFAVHPKFLIKKVEFPPFQYEI